MERGAPLFAVACFALASVCGGGQGAQRPRGVPLERASLYAVGDRFTCLDGSATVPYSFVNDDYCDCRDGSDEPGTAACADGSFHCANVGHVPLRLPSSRVNDGVCDCCDGSDEYAGLADCVDRCDELGREARDEARRMAALVEAGSRLRAELIREGRDAKINMRERLDELDKNRAEADRLRAEREAVKIEAEALEAAALERHNRNVRASEPSDNEKEARDTFARFDSDADGLVHISELKARNLFDVDRDGQVSDDEARSHLAGEDSLDFDAFFERAWPVVKPKLMLEEGAFKPPPTLDETEDGEAEAEAEAEGEEEGESESEGEGEGEEEPEEGEDIETDVRSTYDEETRRLVEAADEARADHSRAANAVRDVDSEMERLKSMLDKDYGPEEEYASLAGRRLEWSDREYTYEVTAFERASQRPASGGGGETSLGTWAGWADDARTVMLYERGASCWNGPDRSARVRLRCGLDTLIVGAGEPNRCEYVIDMETPGACRAEAEGEGEGATRHDEL